MFQLSFFNLYYETRAHTFYVLLESVPTDILSMSVGKRIATGPSYSTFFLRKFYIDAPSLNKLCHWVASLAGVVQISKNISTTNPAFRRDIFAFTCNN